MSQAQESETDERMRLLTELSRRTMICMLEELSLGCEQHGDYSCSGRLRALEKHLRAKHPDAIEFLSRCVENARSLAD